MCQHVCPETAVRSRARAFEAFEAFEGKIFNYFQFNFLISFALQISIGKSSIEARPISKNKN